jgi:Flp pilus assembly protein TadD
MGEFKQAVAVAQANEDAQKKAHALHEIALALTEAGEFKQALEVAQEIEDAELKASTLREIIASIEAKNPPGP